MDWQDRAARNEEIYRSVNGRIEQAARQHGFDAATAFHCECADSACVETIQIPAAEYDSVAADPTRFVVAPKHENEALERVVDRRSTYLVVEKVGEARKQIERDHPRARHNESD